jgi:hypothetical protein
LVLSVGDPFGGLPVGETVEWAGNFTELAALATGLRASDPRELERVLGFHIGRLNEGFSLLLLVEMPELHTVSIQGMTNLSGGREGPPGRTAAEDAARPEVDKRYQEERHKVWDDYKTNISADVKKVGKAWSDLNAAWTAVEATNITGRRRAVKIVPVTRHDDSMSPAVQYPVGAGVPQFNMHKKSKWLIAANVHPNGDWNTLPGWPELTGTFLRDTRGYQEKNRMMKLLAAAHTKPRGKHMAR